MRRVYRGRGRRRVQHDRRDRRHHRAARRPVLLPAARHQGAADDGRGAQVRRREPEDRRLQRQHGRLARARQGVSLPQRQLRLEAAAPELN
ncbi:Adenosylhomocysteinase [Burkholderia gladioli]|nr:Adenosylhomocysteinase [Burkholderia gladioli]